MGKTGQSGAQDGAPPMSEPGTPNSKVDRVSLRDLSVAALPLVLIAAAVFWIAYYFVRPAPSDKVVITTGPDGGYYQAIAQRYQALIARHRVVVELRPSSGAVENLRRLADKSSDVDAGLVQSGIATQDDARGLVSLGNLYYEPLWIFYRGGEVLDRIDQLSGKRLAIGPEGSGNRRLALQLLAAHGVDKAPTTLLDLPISEHAGALRRGEIDASSVVAGPEAPAIRELAKTDGVRLMSLAQAATYTRLFPFLSRVVLPQGALDLVRNVPEQDTAMVAATAILVARGDMHPALMSLLIQAAIRVHNH